MGTLVLALARRQQRDGFHMRGVGEHIHHAGRQQFEAVLVHQDSDIARQRGGMAGDIEQPLGGQLCDPCGSSSRAPTPGRIDQNMRVAMFEPGRIADIPAQIASLMKNCALVDRVASARSLRARSTRPAGSPSTPTTCPACRARASEKLPSPQYRSSTRDSAVQFEQTQRGVRLTSARLTTALIWTKSVGRKLQFQPATPAVDSTVCRHRGRQRLHGADPSRLQVDTHAALLLEFEQRLTIAVRGRIQHAHDQRHRIVGHRHFDLRQPGANRQPGNEFAQWRDQRIHRRREHFASIDGRNQIRAALAKAHQHAALASHVFDAQARARRR